ncbi:MAG TPA: DUF1684 domain-containing protein [Polyangiales bacterium]|nr:DUF1684 domain-containing protein [Polyangiales bacterium]
MSAYEDQISAWRRDRLARLTTKDGWLSLIGRFDLPPGESAVGSDPSCAIQLPARETPLQLGRFVREQRRVQFVPGLLAEVGVRRATTHTSEPLSGPIDVTSDAEGEPDVIVFGTLSLEVMQRGDSFAVRVRDSESDALRSFAGIDHYPIDPAWRVRARLVPYTPEKRIDLLYESGDPQSYRSPGAAIFESDGVEYRIDPVFDGPRPRLYVLFGDRTNRDESYGAGRFLYAPLPEDGHVILDFNQAFNPPCAFTPFAVCPLPPPQNRLALRIEAGEKRPRAVDSRP